jgi:hypothetical protein
MNPIACSCIHVKGFDTMGGQTSHIRLEQDRQTSAPGLVATLLNFSSHAQLGSGCSDGTKPFR